MILMALAKHRHEHLQRFNKTLVQSFAIYCVELENTVIHEESLLTKSQSFVCD
jgi:hypothetical protein